MNLPCEFEVFDRFKLRKEQFIQEFPFQYYVLTPLTTSKEIVFNSFVHHFAVLTSLRDQFPIVGLVVKALLFLLHVLMYGSVLFFLFNRKESLALRFLVAVPVIILMFALTALVFRYVESRYLLPIHPFMTITLAYYIFLTWNKIKAYRLKSN
ncbi:MAG: hypothetical protein JKY48_14415 [Flavobacteriales bacterium]|nr:hypothetical protein [Flavobacteriales bacterium]